eukprot:scaffold1618_cov158-Ochromonas_danica.AAC.14
MVPQISPLTVELFERESLPLDSSSSKRPRFSTTTKDISLEKELFVREEVDRRLSQWAGQINEVDPTTYMGELFKKRGKGGCLQTLSTGGIMCLNHPLFKR